MFKNRKTVRNIAIGIILIMVGSTLAAAIIPAFI